MKLKRKQVGIRMYLDITYPENPMIRFEPIYKDVLVDSFRKTILKKKNFWVLLCLIVVHSVLIYIAWDDILYRAVFSVLTALFLLIFLNFIYFEKNEYDKN